LRYPPLKAPAQARGIYAVAPLRNRAQQRSQTDIGKGIFFISSTLFGVKNIGNIASVTNRKDATSNATRQMNRIT
jgi:hypothetical protein